MCVEQTVPPSNASRSSNRDADRPKRSLDWNRSGADKTRIETRLQWPSVVRLFLGDYVFVPVLTQED